MALFKSELFRSFATGFVLGTLILVGVMVARGDGPNPMIAAAQAAPVALDQTR